jgi:hypothetical protein
MQRLITVCLLVLAGCATQDGQRLVGRQQKNESPIRVERLGTPALLEQQGQFACATEQVLWCVGGEPENGADCRCVYADRAQRQFDSLLGTRTRR